MSIPSEARVQPNEVSTTTKACCWSITINNPTEDDKIAWQQLKDLKWVKEVKGQLEQGDAGTLHIQGMMKTESVRFSQIKRALPRAHIEPARSVTALTKYVEKEETRVGTIQTVKVATQSDIQKEMLRLTLATFNKENPGTEVTQDRLYDWLLMYQTHKDNREFAEIALDASVKSLIRQGYFGIEFVASNPQVRTAFKKYFSEIVIREYARSQGVTRSEGDGTDEGRAQETEEAQGKQSFDDCD